MKLISNLNFISRKIKYILFALVLISSVLVLSKPVNAATATSNARDCDNNAVMKCGALTTKELKIKYMNPNDPSGRLILNAFGISNIDIQEIDKLAVLGQVTKKGEVLVNGKTVATNAVTAGRLNMPGSSKENYQGVTYYMRPPSVSFRSESLQAFVVMENNKFKYAILTSCANPVTAIPVTPTIVEEKVITVKPATVVTKTKVENKVVHVNSQLPKTGPTDVLVIGFTTAVFATLGHILYINRKSIKTKFDNFVLTKLYS